VYRYGFDFYIGLYGLASIDKTNPFLSISHRPSIKSLKKNWEIIRDEMIQAKDKFTGFSLKENFFGERITNDKKWKKIYLNWYGKIPHYVPTLFPKTHKILSLFPDIKLAMFSRLEPGAIIKPHRGIFRGCIRVHVGLETPNSKECFILLDGKKYYWRDGHVQSFDDTYEHEVHNNTDQPRTILFLDVEREMSGIVGWINKLLIQYVAPYSKWINDDIHSDKL